MSYFVSDRATLDAEPRYAETLADIRAATTDLASIGRGGRIFRFGRTVNADAGVLTTIGLFQGSEINETLPSTNVVDSIVSSALADTEVIEIVGHTIDASGNLTRVTQTATLNGRTAVTLGTALARAEYASVVKGTFGSEATNLVGLVAVYDSTEAGGVTTGVPDTATATKLMIDGTANRNASEKAAFSLASDEYAVIDRIDCGVSRSEADSVTADIDVQYREVGGVWTSLGVEISLRAGSVGYVSSEFSRPVWVPKGSDVRMVATSNTANSDIIGRIIGHRALAVR